MNRTENLAPGMRFGDLRIEREIGSGAFGRVWFASDTRLGREVALKVLQPRGFGPTQPEDRARFLEEARIMSRFAHPHIAILYHLHETDEGAYALEMEHLTGGSLDDRLGDDGRLPVDEALAIARDIASALAAAHGAGVIHGDVKPGNVLFSKDGPVKLVDFGLARLLNVQDVAATQKVIAGTPYYLAPEVIGGDAFKPASDVWSLGVVLYRMLAGRLPFAQKNLMTLFLAIQNEAPPPLGREVPVDVARLVDRCLSKQPAQRFADGAAALAGLERRASTSRRRPEPSRPSAAARVIGREVESARITAAMDALGEGVGGLLVVTGSAGIGKSTLTSAAMDEARRRGWAAVPASVSPIDGLMRPLLRAVHPAAEEAPSLGAPSLAAATATTVAFERGMAALVASSPAVVAVEDLHNASLEEVRIFAKARLRLARTPVLWLVSERTSDVGLAGSQHLRAEPLLEAEDASRLDLGPLSAEAIVHLLETEAQGGRFSGAVLDRVVRRSGGNALFALQLVRHMRETGAIVREGDEWLPGPPQAAAAAPPALRDIVARRLQGLPEAMRALLDVAAVDGLEFDGIAVAAVLDRPLLTVLRQLQTLYRTHGLVAPRDRGYRFAHPLLQEVIYSEVAPELQRVMHRALAEHLEGRKEPVDPERLGVHWERSDASSRAVPHLLAAALSASMRLENFRCVDLATRAGVKPGHITPELAEKHVAAVLQAANSLGEIGRQDERDELYADLLRVAPRVADPTLRLRVFAHRGLTRVLGRGLQPGDEEDVRTAADNLPDGADQGIALYVLGLVERVRGRLVDAEARFRAADEKFVRHGAEGRHGSVLDQLGTLARVGGHTRRAAALYAEAARVCRAVGREANAAISDVNAISAEIKAGRIAGHEERLERAARQLDIDGLLGAAARVRVVLAFVRFAIGDLMGARREVGAARDVLRRLEMLPGIVDAEGFSSYLAGAAGDLRQAWQDHAVAVEAASRQGSPSAQASLDAQAAILYARASEPVRAAEVARRAIATEVAAATRVGEDVAAALAEAVLHGLPSREIARLPDLLPADSADDENATLRTTRAWVIGLLAGADPKASADSLEAAARALERPDVGLQRALLRCVAMLLRAEAERRRGKPSDATMTASKAAAAARTLGYAWDRVSPFGGQGRALAT